MVAQMNLFVSYAFNEDNRWIEELAIPLIRALGFEVVNGRRMEGEIIVQGVDQRIRECRGCIGFTTRREPRPNGKFGTHQWVLDELAAARTLKLTVVEVREDTVEVEGAAEFFGQLRYTRDARDKLLVELADRLSKWPTRTVSLRLQPPQARADDFRDFILGGDVTCQYQVQNRGRTIDKGQADIQPINPNFFVELEVPRDDVLVQLEIRKGGSAWKSLGSSLMAIPIEVYDINGAQNAHRTRRKVSRQ